jgi:hypothetical protein
MMWLIRRTVVVLPLVPVTLKMWMWEEHVHDGRGHVARLAHRRADVHPQARRRVDFDDGAAVVGDGRLQRRRDDVDAADVQSDDARHPFHQELVVGVDVVGHVDGRAAGRQVGGPLELEHLAGGQDSFHGVALVQQQALGDRRDGQQGHDVLVAVPAPVVLVLEGDEVLDRVGAVPGHAGRHALGGGDELAVDHQDAVVVADLHLLDHHLLGQLAGPVKGRLQLLLVLHAHGDALAVVAVEGLDHHGPADVIGILANRLELRGDGAPGNGDAVVLQHHLGQLLVAGRFGGDQAGAGGQAGLDLLLVAALPELHQVVVVQPDHGDAALAGLVDDGHGGGAQVVLVADVLDLGDDGVDVDVGGRLAGEDALEDPHRLLAGVDAGLLDPVLEDHLVHTGILGRVALAEEGVHVGQPLELEGHVLGDVAQPGALPDHLEESPWYARCAFVLGEARQQLDEPVGEAGELAGEGVALVLQVQDHPDDGLLAPEIGSRQGADLDDLHGRPPLNRVGGMTEKV